MAGIKDSGLLNRNSISLRERAARTTLHSIRMQGHTYVELREDGKSFIFFCTLCLSPCYSDSVLFDHLKGHLHSQRFAAAKVTLLQSNPWPFNDGVHFFHSSIDNNHPLTDSNFNPAVTSMENSDDVSDFAIVSHNGNAQTSKVNRNSIEDPSDSIIKGSHGTNSCSIEDGCDMLIPEVIIKDKIADLEVKFIGYGKLSARVLEDGVSRRMSRIWCEWLGSNELSNEDFFEIPENDFAIVVFTYNYDLGRLSLIDDVKYLLARSSPNRCMENVESRRKKKWKSSSDSEDIIHPLNNHEESSRDPALSPHNDQFSYLQNISNRTLRRELRRQHRVTADKMCDICQHKMLPDKDVSALMNIRTERLVCSSRNLNGAFHVFHTSCLINWILLCESEIYRNKFVSEPKARHESKKCGTATKNKAKLKDGDTESSTASQIFSVFCPECQGTGLNIEGEDDMERPTFPLSEVFKFKLKSSDAHRAWMKNPEVLQNCSTGFNFPSQSGETAQEVVFPLKLLQFYRAKKS